VITTQQVRIILDRNRNGLDGLPRVPAGGQLGVGVYWDGATRRVEAVEAPRQAEGERVLLSHRLDVTFDDLVRVMAMGGGGHSGRAVPYHAGVSGPPQTH
jgi:hypothetical protein